MKKLLIVLFVFFSLIVYSQEMRIGVFRKYQIKRITMAYHHGSYAILADTLNYGSILPNEFVDISVDGNYLRLRVGVVDKGLFSKIILHGNKLGSSLSLNPKTPSHIKSRKYSGDFELLARDGYITIVNKVDINDYLAGVVESEGGGGKAIEYYKVQAVMSRTYALKYINKHRDEGFSLCDQVHCQAYHHQLSYTPTIKDAVIATNGRVLVDSINYHLLDTYFSANCGGQTCEPEDVWSSTIPYLRTFIDTFCIYTKQATWEKTISKVKWRNFLVSQFQYPEQDSLWASCLYSFKQDARKAFYVSPVLGIPLRDIRDEFHLKSTFFSVEPQGENVLISGRGYGHGVGLCQEGAMNMAKKNYNYIQIAKFYFPGAIIINLSDQEFFKQLARTGEFKL